MFARILALLCCLYLPATLAAGLDDADARLFQAQKSLAEKNNPSAQYHLGEMYEQALGTEQDLTQAFFWYGKAAQQGHPFAKRKLAMRAEIERRILQERAEEEQARTTAPAAAAAAPAPAARLEAAPKRDPAAEKARRRAEIRERLQKQQAEYREAFE